MKTPRLSVLATSAALLAALSSSSQATAIGGAVTSGSGAYVKLVVPFTESTPDNTVGNNTFQDPNLYAFDETQNVNAPDPIAVDIGGIGGVIPANTVVASHYVFFDPNGSTHQEGWVDFDSPILGVVTSTNRLLGSDIYVNPGVTYLNPGARGLEGGDSVAIDGALDYRLLVDWTASTPGDYVRVFTQRSPGAVPDTGFSLALFGIGLGALGVARRKTGK
jgi:hypothetical protein